MAIMGHCASANARFYEGAILRRRMTDFGVCRQAEDMNVAHPPLTRIANALHMADSLCITGNGGNVVGRAVVAIYSAGFRQGSAFVLIPARGDLLYRAPYLPNNRPHGLPPFPEILGTIMAALAAGALLSRLQTAGLFRPGTMVNTAVMTMLIAAFFAHGAQAILLLLIETLMPGIRFGLSNAMAHIMVLAWPNRRTPTRNTRHG